MALVWSVPVVAAALAFGLLAARARALEEAGRLLAVEVARLGELRRPLAALRVTAAETDARVSAFRSRHAPVPGSPDADGREGAEDGTGTVPGPALSPVRGNGRGGDAGDPVPGHGDRGA